MIDENPTERTEIKMNVVFFFDTCCDHDCIVVDVEDGVKETKQKTENEDQRVRVKSPFVPSSSSCDHCCCFLLESLSRWLWFWID